MFVIDPHFCGMSRCQSCNWPHDVNHVTKRVFQKHSLNEICLITNLSKHSIDPRSTKYVTIHDVTISTNGKWTDTNTSTQPGPMVLFATPGMLHAGLSLQVCMMHYIWGKRHDVLYMGEGKKRF